MNSYVLLHFEQKYDFTIITKLHRATPLWLVAHTTFDNDRNIILCSKFNRTEIHKISINCNKTKQSYTQLDSRKQVIAL